MCPELNKPNLAMGHKYHQDSRCIILQLGQAGFVVVVVVVGDS